MATDGAMVHVKVSKKVKNEAQKVARLLGVPLSLVAEQAFKRFAAQRRLVVEEEPYKPTPYLSKILREAQKNRDNPKFWSGPFFSSEEAVAHLRGITKKK